MMTMWNEGESGGCSVAMRIRPLELYRWVHVACGCRGMMAMPLRLELECANMAFL